MSGPHNTANTTTSTECLPRDEKKDAELTKAISLPVKADATKAVPLHDSLLDVLIQVGSGSLLSLLHTCP